MSQTDTAPDTEARTGEGKKGKKGKLLMIVGAVVVIGLGAFVGLKVFGGGSEDAETAAAEAEATEESADGEVLELDTITTVVGGEGDLARVSLALVLSEDAIADTVSSRLPVVKDATVREVARSNSQQLLTPDGADDLRARLKDRTDEIYADGEVLRVLITELVVQ